MFKTRIRAIAGMSLLASAIGLVALGANVIDDTPSSTHQAYGTYTCYDYATQTFYQCFDPS